MSFAALVCVVGENEKAHYVVTICRYEPLSCNLMVRGTTKLTVRIQDAVQFAQSRDLPWVASTTQDLLGHRTESRSISGWQSQKGSLAAQSMIRSDVQIARYRTPYNWAQWFCTCTGLMAKICPARDVSSNNHSESNHSLVLVEDRGHQLLLK